MNRNSIIIIFSTILCMSLLINTLLYNNTQKYKISMNQTTQSLEQSLNQLSDKLSNTTQMIENVKSENEQLKRVNTEMIGKIHTLETSSARQLEVESNIQKITKIIESLPDVTKRMAIIKELREENGVNVLALDNVIWFSGEEAIQAAKEDNEPNAASLNNNFYIRNEHTENAKVVLGNDAMIFVLNGAMLQVIESKEFTSGKTEITNRLFHILSVNDKITILEEQYRP